MTYVYVLLLLFVMNDGTVKTQTITAPSMELCNETKPLILKDYGSHTKELHKLSGYCLRMETE